MPEYSSPAPRSAQNRGLASRGEQVMGSLKIDPYAASPSSAMIGYPNSASMNYNNQSPYLQNVSPYPQSQFAYPQTSAVYPQSMPTFAHQMPSYSQNMPNQFQNSPYLQNDQNLMLQKLLEEMNSNYERDLQDQNSELLKKIEQIERENQRLARGVDSDEEDNLEYEDQQVVSDAVDRAIRQYEQAKAREEAELQQKQRRDEERSLRMIPRPSPEDILYAPISEKELFEHATSLPPVSKPFISPSIYDVRGSRRQERDRYENDTNRTRGKTNIDEDEIPLDNPSRVGTQDVKNMIGKSLIKKDLLSTLLYKARENKPSAAPASKPANVLNDFNEVKKRNEEERKEKLENDHRNEMIQKFRYFDANKAKGQNLNWIFKNVKRN